MWVLIMEKVWAKLHGNYTNIDGGLSKEVILNINLKNYFLFLNKFF